MINTQRNNKWSVVLLIATCMLVPIPSTHATAVNETRFWYKNVTDCSGPAVFITRELQANPDAQCDAALTAISACTPILDPAGVPSNHKEKKRVDRSRRRFWKALMQKAGVVEASLGYPVAGEDTAASEDHPEDDVDVNKDNKDADVDITKELPDTVDTLDAPKDGSNKRRKRPELKSPPTMDDQEDGSLYRREDAPKDEKRDGVFFRSTFQCLPSMAEQLSVSSETDVYLAINILNNDTTIGCNEPNRIVRQNFFLADGQCHGIGSSFFKATCTPRGNSTVIQCKDSGCTDCTEQPMMTGTDGQCSNEQMLPGTKTSFYFQCFAKGAESAPAPEPQPADDTPTKPEVPEIPTEEPADAPAPEEVPSDPNAIPTEDGNGFLVDTDVIPDESIAANLTSDATIGTNDTFTDDNSTDPAVDDSQNGSASTPSGASQSMTPVVTTLVMAVVTAAGWLAL
jgi:hypothetical protein